MKITTQGIGILTVALGIAFSTAPLATGEIGPELFAPGIISTDGFELGAAFGPDGKSFYFTSISEGFTTSTIMVSHLVNDVWSTPQPVVFADARYRDLDAALSPDGQVMAFQSDRPLEGDERKDWDIWISRMGDDGWGEPQNAGPEINNSGVQTFPVFLADGSLMYSTNAGAGRDDLDIVVARPEGSGFAAPEPISSPPNSLENDSNAVISPDGNLMVIGSTSYTGHMGGGDLYLLEKTDTGWSRPRPIPAVNTEFRELAPAFSPNGDWLFFTSNRPRQSGSEGGPGDIYVMLVDAMMVNSH